MEAPGEAVAACWTAFDALARAGGGTAEAIAAAAPLQLALLCDPANRRDGAELRSGDDVGPEQLGLVAERAMELDSRRSKGAFYTDSTIARRLVGVAAESVDLTSGTVCDPACGGGALLLAAADRLADAAIVPDEALRRLVGCDLDPLAAAVCEAAVVLWAVRRGGLLGARPTISVADGLLMMGDHRLVVANPPFQTPLATTTARSAEQRRVLARTYGDVASATTDTAWLFLRQCVRLLDVGGAAVVILPESSLSASGAAEVREVVASEADLAALWTAGAQVFDAQVRVCAVVLRRQATGAESVRRYRGPDVDPVDEAPPVAAVSWAPLLVRTGGPPRVSLDAGAGSVGDRWATTAGHRDQFYGLAECVREATDAELGDSGSTLRLVTTGLIDPAVDRWGRQEVRFDKRKWRAPVVDEALLRRDPALFGWVDRLLCPKIFVAVQTNVVEAACDHLGRAVGSTPLISVWPTDIGADAGESLDRLLAVLLAPALSAQLVTELRGGGLSNDAIRVTAARLRDVPLPLDDEAWGTGAKAAAAATSAAAVRDGEAWATALDLLGESMNVAYGLDPATGAATLEWWRETRPPWRG